MKINVTCENCLWRMELVRRVEAPEEIPLVCHRCERIILARVTAQSLFANAPRITA